MVYLSYRACVGKFKKNAAQPLLCCVSFSCAGEYANCLSVDALCHIHVKVLWGSVHLAELSLVPAQRV